MDVTKVISESSYAKYTHKNCHQAFGELVKKGIYEKNYLRLATHTEHTFWFKNTDKIKPDTFHLEEAGEVSFSNIMLPDPTKTKIIKKLSSLPVGGIHILRYVIPCDRGGKWINIYFKQEIVGAVSLVNLDEILKEQKEIDFYTVKGDALLSTLKLYKKKTDVGDIHMSVDISVI